jgi:uncharacterized sulfatase
MMNLRSLWLWAGLVAASLSHAAERPNFLLIIADDLCWRDLGCTGNPDVRTPNIDALASQGMTLRAMFSPAATCSPLRHALYTGLDPVRSGAYPNHTRVDPPTASIFTHLKTAGYRVGLQAKSHVSPISSFPYELISNDQNDHAALARFIGRDPHQPWLAVYASHHPHSPWTAGPRGLYDSSKIAPPAYLHDNAETRQALAAYYAEVSALDEQVGACLRAIDQAGQRDSTLVLFVSEQGSSMPYGGKWSLYDNGIRSAAFARWPGRIAAGSVSDALMSYTDVTPTFLQAAGIDPASLDTGCPDAAGQRGFDGRGFLPVLLGRADQHRDLVFAQHTAVGVIGNKNPYPSRSVRDARHKYIRNLASENEFFINGIHNDPVYHSWVRDAANDAALAQRVRRLSHRPAEELYDLASDPLEQRNLAADPSMAAVKARLAQALDRWMAQQGDRGLDTELHALSRQPKNSRDQSAGKTNPKKAGKKKDPR